MLTQSSTMNSNNVGAKEILAMELHKYGILIAGIQESRLEGEGCVEIIGNDKG